MTPPRSRRRSRRIVVINPNTSAPMTDAVVRAAEKVAGTGTRIVGATPSSGVSEIESHVDEAPSLDDPVDRRQAGPSVDTPMQGQVTSEQPYVVGVAGSIGLEDGVPGPRQRGIGVAEGGARCATPSRCGVLRPHRAVFLDDARRRRQVGAAWDLPVAH